MAQFVLGFRRGPVTKDRAVARASAVLREIDRVGLLGEVSDLGASVFGFLTDLSPESRAHWESARQAIVVEEKTPAGEAKNRKTEEDSFGMGRKRKKDEEDIEPEEA